MGNCCHSEYESQKDPGETTDPIELDFSKPKIDRTQTVDINIILNEIIDKYNQEHPKPEKVKDKDKDKDKEKEPEIVFTVKRMNCRINI